MHVRIIGLLSLALACGGAESTDLFTNGIDGGAGNDSGKSDGGAGNDGSPGNDGGPGSDSGKDCKALLGQLEQLRFQATACTGGSGGACGKFIADFCCPFSVTDDSSNESKAFEAALNAYKNQCTPPTCPGTPCRQDPSKMCNPNGHCVP